MAQEIIDEKKIQENLFNFGIVSSPLVEQSREELESATVSFDPGQPTYGALPYFNNRKQIITHMPQELAYFNCDVDSEEGKDDLKRDSEGILLFEMKAGFPLSKLSEQILANYPPLEKEGKVISIFGLSGSGKSVALEAIKEQKKDSVVIIDNDTSRYNLLAKIVSEAEKINGKTAAQIKDSKVVHNRISGPFYLMLNHVTVELKNRGYSVVRVSTEPYGQADIGFYIEHPDGIDPVHALDMGEGEIEAASEKLYRRTIQRVGDKDNYDWASPELITRFEDMRDVMVQVPLAVHERFIRNVGGRLKYGHYSTLHNPKVDSKDEAKRNILNQISTVL